MGIPFGPLNPKFYDTFSRFLPTTQPQEEEEDGLTQVQKLLAPLGLSMPSPRANILLPETGFFGRHPNLSRGIENLLLGAAGTAPSETPGEGIANVARGVLGIPAMRQQIQLQRMLGPLGVASTVDQLGMAGMRRDLMRSQTAQNQAQISHMQALEAAARDKPYKTDFRSPIPRIGGGSYLGWDEKTNQLISGPEDIDWERTKSSTGKDSDAEQAFARWVEEQQVENPDFVPTSADEMRFHKEWAGDPFGFQAANKAAALGNVREDIEMNFKSGDTIYRNQREEFQNTLKLLEDPTAAVFAGEIPPQGNILSATKLRKQDVKKKLDALDRKYANWSRDIVGRKTKSTFEEYTAPTPFPKGTAIDDATAEKLFEEAGRDPRKAEKLAKERGYTF